MERKIGETFEFEGKTLQVKATNDDGCEGCIFNAKCTRGIKSVTGLCGSIYRDDKKDVIFVEVKDEQQQEQAEQPQTEQQPQKLNLCEILKDCPKGEMFWSPLLGDVKLYDIDEEAKTVDVTTKDLATWEINADGTITIDDITSEVIMLYPSRERCDWSTFKYEPKKKRFDPNTLQPFDRVLVRDNKDLTWKINIYSHKYYNPNHPYQCITSVYRYCIPYNDDTKHLVGTTDDAPDFYKYWED